MKPARIMALASTFRGYDILTMTGSEAMIDRIVYHEAPARCCRLRRHRARSTATIASALLLLLAHGGAALAQDLPQSATPRGVIFAFLDETASSRDSVNRMKFRSRLTGELASISPISFKGMVREGTEIRIDSIFALPPSPDDRASRVAAYVTLHGSDQADQLSIFCRGDSIWRIEALREFPTASQRKIVARTLEDLDTTSPEQRLRRRDLERLLLPNDSLIALFSTGVAAADKIIHPLEAAKQWRGFALREVDFSALEEYRELDDDVTDAKRIFYTIDRPALEQLKRKVGILRVEREPLNPEIILLVAGSLRSDSFGYLYAPSSALPPLSPEGYFLLRPAAEHWWLYKKSIQ